ncbi:MAG: hypothetical protein KDK23_07235 [Leptospiraceae bacterium]|nr:hypothetical protein [Leptospiraceae bacterium]
MTGRFFRSLFWGVLLASIIAWAYAGTVTAGYRETILVEDRMEGLQEEVISPGETTFLPSLAIPNRIRLHRIQLEPRFLRFPWIYQFPAGQLLGLDDSFAVQVEAHYEYSISADRIRVLFLSLPVADWSQLQPYLELRMRSFWAEKMRELAPNEAALAGLENDLNTYVRQDLRGDLNNYFRPEGIEFKRIYVERIYVPDAVRYNATLQAGQDLLNNRLERISIIDQARAKKQASQILNEVYLDRLEKMAMLLQKYPELRDYAAVDSLSENVRVLVMPYEQYFRGQQQSMPAPRGNPRQTGTGPGAGEPPVEPFDFTTIEGNESVQSQEIPARDRSTFPGMERSSQAAAPDGGFRDLTPP